MEIPLSKSPLVPTWILNRKACSSSSYAKIKISSHGSLLTWELAEHYLNINPGAKPVKQPLRRFGDKKRQAISKKIAKQLKAGFIREVIHTL